MSTEQSLGTDRPAGGHPGADPSLGQLLRWLTGITAPVHPPLYLSTVFRILGLASAVVFYAVAGGGVVAIVGGASPGPVFGWLAGIAVVKALLFYLEQFTGHYVAFKALELLRTTVFARLWPKAPAVVTHSRSGDVLTSLTRDVDRIEVVYAHTFAPLVSAFVVPVAMMAAAGVLTDWRVVLVPAACVLVSLLVVPWVGFRASMRAGDELLGVRRRLGHHVTDSVFGVEEVVGYGRQDERLAETAELGDAVAEMARPSRVQEARRRAANTALMLLASISVLWVGMRIGMDPVWLAALGAGSLRLFDGPRGIEDAVGYLDKSLAAARRLWQISHSPQAVADGAEELVLAAAPRIRLDGLTYHHRDADGHPSGFALRDVSIDVPAGSHAVLVGPSGCGKTTTVQALQRYFDPDAGQVLIDDVPVGRYTLDSLRGAVVAVSQDNQLLNATISENLRLGAPGATDEELVRALRLAEFEDDLAGMPQGLATPVGQFGTKLSGGQVQRLCLARALLLGPKVLVLDEFTANLNPSLADAIRANLARELVDVTVIEITHRLDADLDADQVVVLDAGRVMTQEGERWRG